MTRARGLVLIAGLVLAAAGARADGFFTRDLGEAGTPEACMERATRSLTTYFRENGATDFLVQPGEWSVQGYDMPPGDVQVQIVCPFRNGLVPFALMFSYSHGPASDRMTVVDGVDAIWQRPQGPALTK